MKHFPQKFRYKKRNTHKSQTVEIVRGRQKWWFLFFEISMKALWKQYRSEIWSKKKSFFILLIFIFLVNILEVLAPLYYKDIVNFLGMDYSPQNEAIIFYAFFWVSIFYAGMWISWRIFDGFVIHHQAAGMRDLDKMAFGVLQKQKYLFFQNEFSGKIIKKSGKFVKSFEHISDWFLFNFWNVLTLVSITFFAFYRQQTDFAYIFLAWITVFLGFTTWFAFFAYKYNKVSSEADSYIGAMYADSFSQILTVKSQAIEMSEYERVQNAIDDHFEKQKKAWIMQFIMFAVQGILAIGMELLLVFLMIQKWKNGTFEVGEFVFFQTVLLFVVHRIWEFGRGFRNLFGAIADASEMAEIIDQTDIEEDGKNAKHFEITKGEIVFEKVDFGYGKNSTETENVGAYQYTPESHQNPATEKKNTSIRAKDVSPLQDGLFHNFSLNIPAGQKVALVGHSGSGKTTITNLLFRFFEVQNGKILFDGIESRDFTYHSLRSQISLVPQNPEMFHRTLKENITLGKNFSDEKIWEALEKAQGKIFAENLPQKLHTMIGERGVKLSGGEKQRVALARAFLENAPIIVLDEATSALDSITENELQKAIKILLHQKTAIVIAHRLSTIFQMDRILVLDNGKIIEDGTHAELLEKKGKYFAMWTHQKGGFLGEEE